jgi:hypothetical protein
MTPSPSALSIQRETSSVGSQPEITRAFGILCTSNIGPQQLLRPSRLQFTTLERAVISELHRSFRPELIGDAMKGGAQSSGVLAVSLLNEGLMIQEISHDNRDGNFWPKTGFRCVL